MFVTGAKFEDDSRLASRKYARIVQKGSGLRFDTKIPKFTRESSLSTCGARSSATACLSDRKIM
ncbi:hypothetical protein LXA43DRAFT_1105761 [Ganoderma leucocontextum]|nr:hypothetical protein LXA43DRAFT_1105761 [Ganoderma leucocontextum]